MASRRAAGAGSGGGGFPNRGAMPVPVVDGTGPAAARKPGDGDRAPLLTAVALSVRNRPIRVGDAVRGDGEVAPGVTGGDGSADRLARSAAAMVDDPLTSAQSAAAMPRKPVVATFTPGVASSSSTMGHKPSRQAQMRGVSPFRVTALIALGASLASRARQRVSCATRTGMSAMTDDAARWMGSSPLSLAAVSRTPRVCASDDSTAMLRYFAANEHADGRDRHHKAFTARTSSDDNT